MVLEMYDQKETDRLEPYFQSDPLLTEQYRDILRTYTLDSEKRLMLAILEDAVKCFQAPAEFAGGRRQDISRIAEEWILREDPEWPFSFDNVCEFLDIDPLYLRKGLMRWKSAKPPERAAQIKRLTESTRQEAQTMSDDVGVVEADKCRRMSDRRTERMSVKTPEQRLHAAVLALVYLGRRGGRRFVAHREIARDQNVPTRDVLSIMRNLSAAGFVTERAGREGGVSIAKPLSKISLKELYEVCNT